MVNTRTTPSKVNPIKDSSFISTATPKKPRTPNHTSIQKPPIESKSKKSKSKPKKQKRKKNDPINDTVSASELSNPARHDRLTVTLVPSSAISKNRLKKPKATTKTDPDSLPDLKSSSNYSDNDKNFDEQSIELIKNYTISKSGSARRKPKSRPVTTGDNEKYQTVPWADDLGPYYGGGSDQTDLFADEIESDASSEYHFNNSCSDSSVAALALSKTDLDITVNNVAEYAEQWVPINDSVSNSKLNLNDECTKSTTELGIPSQVTFTDQVDVITLNNENTTDASEIGVESHRQEIAESIPTATLPKLKTHKLKLVMYPLAPPRPRAPPLAHHEQFTDIGVETLDSTAFTRLSTPFVRNVWRCRKTDAFQHDTTRPLTAILPQQPDSISNPPKELNQIDIQLLKLNTLNKKVASIQSDPTTLTSNTNFHNHPRGKKQNSTCQKRVLKLRVTSAFSRLPLAKTSRMSQLQLDLLNQETKRIKPNRSAVKPNRSGAALLNLARSFNVNNLNERASRIIHASKQNTYPVECVDPIKDRLDKDGHNDSEKPAITLNVVADPLAESLNTHRAREHTKITVAPNQTHHATHHTPYILGQINVSKDRPKTSIVTNLKTQCLRGNQSIVLSDQTNSAELKEATFCKSKRPTTRNLYEDQPKNHILPPAVHFQELLLTVNQPPTKSTFANATFEKLTDRLKSSYQQDCSTCEHCNRQRNVADKDKINQPKCSIKPLEIAIELSPARIPSHILTFERNQGLRLPSSSALPFLTQNDVLTKRLPDDGSVVPICATHARVLQSRQKKRSLEIVWTTAGTKNKSKSRQNTQADLSSGNPIPPEVLASVVSQRISNYILMTQQHRREMQAERQTSGRLKELSILPQSHFPKISNTTNHTTESGNDTRQHSKSAENLQTNLDSAMSTFVHFSHRATSYPLLGKSIKSKNTDIDTLCQSNIIYKHSHPITKTTHPKTPPQMDQKHANTTMLTNSLLIDPSTNSSDDIFDTKQLNCATPSPWNYILNNG
ncbi:hypothetical protein O5D80_000717 [Batrachochytrium dendrobatidis]|nr:hypothetical protein O5D80_000717 [Batrachochytrium dendrobatidis]